MIKSFIKASRLRTLPLSVSGVIVGSFLGNKDYLSTIGSSNFQNCYTCLLPISTSVFWLAILTAISFQVLSNFANDYGDGIKGIDKNREGEARMVSSGAISYRQMKLAIIVTTIISLFISILLIYVSFGKENFTYAFLFFILSLLSIAASIKYTVGKFAYGYSGFGDLFVFVFFGIVGVVGSYFLYTKQINFKVFLPAISIGLLSVAVLNLNNLRDIKSDKANNKITLVVKLGISNAKKYHYSLIIGAFLSAFWYVNLDFKTKYQLIFMLAFIPLAKNIRTVYYNKVPSELDSELKKVALSTFMFAILLGLSSIFG